MYRERKTFYQQLQAKRNSKVLVYVTGDRPGMETRIASDVYDYFVNQLDRIGKASKISLYLYTRGGDTLAAWSIINLIHQFSDDVEIIVPSKCHSAGTLMSLGASRIVMTKQATLGPIDPSVNHPLNPQIPGAPPDAKVPVSVEAIEGFIQLAKEECISTRKANSDAILSILSQKIHPLVLGQVYRARAQIRMLAARLVVRQVKDKKMIDKIIKFLSSQSGSHDYTIHRREARDELGLNIEKPDDSLYAIIKNIYDDIEKEMELASKFDPNSYMGADQVKPYNFRRCIIESIDGGSYYFSSEGTMSRQQIQAQPGVLQNVIQDKRSFEGWKYEKD